MKSNLIISKMICYVERIQQYTEKQNYEEFTKNTIVAEACVFNLSQLGELANKLDSKYKDENSSIPWKQIYGLRNRIVHDYEGVNLTLVWEIIKNDLPKLREDLMMLLSI